jgi:hypothetical protein
MVHVYVFRHPTRCTTNTTNWYGNIPVSDRCCMQYAFALLLAAAIWHVLNFFLYLQGICRAWNSKSSGVFLTSRLRERAVKGIHIFIENVRNIRNWRVARDCIWAVVQLLTQIGADWCSNSRARDDFHRIMICGSISRRLIDHEDQNVTTVYERTQRGWGAANVR